MEFNEHRVDIHAIYGQLFGAARAVPNFYRLPCWAVRSARRFLHLVMDHFFDGYFIIEPKVTIASAVWSFRRSMQLVGLKLDPEKAQLPATL